MTPKRGEAHPNAKLDEAAVLLIREQTALRLAKQPYLSNQELCAMFGITTQTVQSIRKRKTWRHVP